MLRSRPKQIGWTPPARAPMLRACGRSNPVTSHRLLGRRYPRNGGGHEQQHFSAGQSAHILWLVRGCRRLCRHVRGLRLRLHVQRLCGVFAAGFRSLARLGFAGVLAGRFSLFRPRERERSSRRSVRLPSIGHRWHDPDRDRLGCCKHGAQLARSLRRLWPWGRTGRRLLLRSRRGRSPAMVRQAPRLCIRSRRQRHRCRYPRDAAPRIASHRGSGMARRLPRSRWPCRRRGRGNGGHDRERSPRSRGGSRRRSAAIRSPIGAAGGDARASGDNIPAVCRSLYRLFDVFVRTVCSVRSPRPLRAGSWHPTVFRCCAAGRDWCR
jgi:hypothetical protein